MVFPMPALVFAMATLVMLAVIGDVREFHSLPRWSRPSKGEQKRSWRNETRATVPKNRQAKWRADQRKQK